MVGMQTSDPRDQEALPPAYFDAIDNIRDMKRQQWSITYLGLAIIVVLFTMTAFNEFDSAGIKLALAAIGVLVVVLGGWALGSAQRSLVRSRDGMEALERRIDRKSGRVEKPGGRQERGWGSLVFPLMMLISLMIGAWLLSWQLFSRDPSHMLLATLLAVDVISCLFFMALGVEPSPRPDLPSGRKTQ